MGRRPLDFYALHQGGPEDMEQMGRHSATHVHARYEEGDGRTVHLLREKFPSPPIASFSSGPYDVSPIIDRHAMRHVAAPSLAEASVRPIL